MLDDLGTRFDPHYYLPVNGKQYRMLCPTAERGLELRRMFHDDSVAVTSKQEIVLLQEIAGPAWDEMKADGIGWSRMVHVARTGLFFYALGPEAAEAHWERGLSRAEGNSIPPEPKSKRPGVLDRIRARRATTGTGTPEAVRGSGQSPAKSASGSGGTSQATPPPLSIGDSLRRSPGSMYWSAGQ